VRLIIILALIAIAFLPNAASAGCTAPEWDVSPEAAPGESIDIVGRYFIDGCDDTGGTEDSGGLCSSAPIAQPNEEQPLADVGFRLVRDGQKIEAITTSASPGGGISASLEVPRNAAPGRYQVVATYYGEKQDSQAVRVVEAVGGPDATATDG